MPSQIRPTRLEVTDRFPMLGFTVRADGAKRYEVAIASDPLLFQPDAKAKRTRQTFYSSRGAGMQTIDRGEAVYIVPAEVLSRFAGQDKLYFAVATYANGPSTPPEISGIPDQGSPYVNLKGLTGRSLRRIRILPSRQRAMANYQNGAGSELEWAGDAAAPGTKPVSPSQPESVAPNPAAPVAPAAVAQRTAALEYNDGFGPLPDRPAESGDAGGGIDFPLPDEPAAARATALDQQAPEYPGASRFVPAKWFGRRDQRQIRRIVIHITDGGSKISGTIGWFQNPERDGQPVKVSAHYVVGQDGEVVQMVRHADVAWHASSANSDSIGIEHVANTRGLVPTEAQYFASAALVTWLADQYGIALDRTHILGHSEADPRTTHTGCPNAVWDWDHYMQLINSRSCEPQAATEQGFARQAIMNTATGALPCTARGLATARPIPLDQKTTARLPHARAVTTAERVIIDTALATLAGPLAPSILALRTVARATGVSIGVGPAAGFSCLMGMGGGIGIIFAADGGIGVYGKFEISAGILDSIEAGMQVTIVRGGIEAFNDVAFAVGGAFVEGIDVAVQVLFNLKEGFVGVTFELGAGIALEPIEIFGAIEGSLSEAISGAEALATTNAELAARRGPDRALPRTARSFGTSPIPLDQKKAARLPQARELSSAERFVVEAALATLAVPLAPTILPLRAISRATGLSIGVGPAAGVGFVFGLGGGFGVIFAPDGGIGVYGKIEVKAGLLDSIQAGMQVTILRGGIEAFNDVATAIGGAFVEGIDAGIQVLFNAEEGFLGVSFELGVGVAAEPIEVFNAIEGSLSEAISGAEALARTNGGAIARRGAAGACALDDDGLMQTAQRLGATEVVASLIKEGARPEDIQRLLNIVCHTPDPVPLISASAARSLATSPDKSSGNGGSVIQTRHPRLVRPPAPRRFTRAMDGGVTEAVVSAIAGVVIDRITKPEGNITWSLDQWRGIKHPNDQAPSHPAQFRDAPTIRLDEWPKTEGIGDDVQYAWFSIDWQYNGVSLGNIRITNIGTEGAWLRSLNVDSRIMDDNIVYPPGNPTYAAIRIRFTYHFVWPLESDDIAIQDVHLFGDGSYEVSGSFVQ